ncbi:MAG: NUDIX domain-containing protein [Bacteroidales bacterium]|jgi:8-oxo-dGTP pyrophosphatase MutT (NUDIX family)|nr:NUDIX domain-containing protein [Bacteroidales bacterium]
MQYPIRVFSDNHFVDLYSDIEFHRFANSYQHIQAAGGIVYDEKGHVLLIYRLGYWDFPKGKMEPHENHEETALREVEEETGATPLIITKTLPSTFHTYHLNDTPVLKQTFWYEMLTHSHAKLVPQHEEDILRARWVVRENVRNFLKKSYPSIRELWEKIQP